jgi:hypothetical protein
MMAGGGRRELGGGARRQSVQTTFAEGIFYGLARFARAEPGESDEHARSTRTQRELRLRLVRCFTGQGVDAERRPTSMVVGGVERW